MDSEDNEPRIKPVPEPTEEINFEKWKQVINGNFPDLVLPAEVGLAMMAQVLINDITNPAAVVLVDVPSSGKTLTVNFFDGISELTYASDKFTPASFLSNAANVKREQLKDVDLLPRIRYKMLLVRDMATMFAKKEDDLRDSLGTLIRVLDGEGISADTGIHGQRKYEGDYLFMLFAATTPIHPRVWTLMGNLGSRLFFLDMKSREKSDEELVAQVTGKAHKQLQKSSQEATKNFLYGLWNKYPQGVDWDTNGEDKELMSIITRCSRMLAKLRGVINIWNERGGDSEVYNYSQPVIENPDRIIQLLYNMARGHALATGRTQINKEDLQIIIRIALDSAPRIRATLFKALLDNGGEMKTHEVEEVLHVSKPTALKEMETLKLLGLCDVTQIDPNTLIKDVEKTLKLLPNFEWFLSPECHILRGDTEMQMLVNAGIM